jgi:hypothetical protein
VGTVGQILEDTTNGKLYICTDATNPYVWEEVGSGGGGGGVSDVQVAGTSVVNAGVANIDYANSTTAGVLKVSNGVIVGNTGYISCSPRTYADYAGLGNSYFISKGTLENVIDGKGLVNNTNYATSTTAGVIKPAHGFNVSSMTGTTYGTNYPYSTYSSLDAGTFISKGTLDGVITGKGLVDQTDLATKQDALTAGTGITIDANNVISATSGGLITLSYGISTWNDFIAAYNAGEIVYCRASSGSDPSVGSQTRMAFMAYVNNATNPTEVEFQYVRSVSAKSASNQSDQVFVYKLTSAGAWTVVTRPVMVKIAAGTNAESSYASNTLTINPRLYTTTGQNTDGGVTQKLFTDTVGNIESALNLINNGGGN